MPFKPKVPCKHPGCAALVPAGTKYSEAHRPLHPEEIRSAYRRGYDAKWRKASKAFLRANPLCVRCMAEGKYVKATVVDHVIVRGKMNLPPRCKKVLDICSNSA